MSRTPNVHNLSTEINKLQHSSEYSPDQAKSWRKPADKSKETIGNFIKLDSKCRSLHSRLTTTKERLKKQEKLQARTEKFKKSNDQRLLLQKARYAILQHNREEEMKALEDKLRRTSRSASESRSHSFAKWREKSKEKLKKLRNEEEKHMLLKLELYNKKQIESRQQHKEELSKKSNRMVLINSKVEVARKKLHSNSDSDQNYYQAISKSNRISSKQQKARIELEKKVDDKKKRDVQREMRKRFNISELEQVEARKDEKLKEKQNKSFQVIQQRKSDWDSLLEAKQERERMKNERSADILENRKKTELKFKLDIISKHSQIDQKLNMRKTSHEIFTQRKRRLSMKRAIERDNIRRMKFFISKSKEPVDISRIMTTFYSEK